MTLLVEETGALSLDLFAAHGEEVYALFFEEIRAVSGMSSSLELKSVVDSFANTSGASTCGHSACLVRMLLLEFWLGQMDIFQSLRTLL